MANISAVTQRYHTTPRFTQRRRSQGAAQAARSRFSARSTRHHATTTPSALASTNTGTENENRFVGHKHKHTAAASNAHSASTTVGQRALWPRHNARTARIADHTTMVSAAAMPTAMAGMYSLFTPSQTATPRPAAAKANAIPCTSKASRMSCELCVCVGPSTATSSRYNRKEQPEKRLWTCGLNFAPSTNP